LSCRYFDYSLDGIIGEEDTEFHYPYLVGNGRPLFTDETKPGEFELVSSTTFASGTLGLICRRRR
jgi:hypothetical protein